MAVEAGVRAGRGTQGVCIGMMGWEGCVTPYRIVQYGTAIGTDGVRDGSERPGYRFTTRLSEPSEFGCSALSDVYTTR